MPKPVLLVLFASLVCAAACGERQGGEPGCRSEADCAAGEICDGGSCRPEEPRGCSKPCEGAQPVCDEEKGYCKVCTLSAGCGGGTPFCMVAANGGEGACVGCRDQGDCTPPALCDPERHVCTGCTETEGCSGALPICEEGTCVACTAIRGCEAGQVCDRSVPGGACVTCTRAEGCDPGQVCDPTAPGGACVTCTLGDGCSGETPACDTSVPGGECVECTSAADCSGDRLCDAASRRCVTCNEAGMGCSEPTPRCDVTAENGRGACVECLDDVDCGGAAPICHPERRSCVGCASDSDCFGSTPRCDPTALNGTGACVACLSSADCGGETPICDRTAEGGMGACAACTEDLGCGAGRFCDSSTGVAVCVTCTATRGCGGPTPVCDTETQGGVCVECVTDGDCDADPTTPLCDRIRVPGRGRCVTCTIDDRGCGGDTPVCWAEAAGGRGVCNRCTAAKGCTGETPACDMSVHQGLCVTCTAAAGCGGTTPFCDTGVPGGVCRQCLTDGTGCTGTRPACDTGAAGGLGECVRCVSNADCPASSATCDPATRSCVECVTSIDCGGLEPVCDVAARSCVRCTATEGCGSEAPYCVEVGGVPRCVECRDTSEDCDQEVEYCFMGVCRNGASELLQAVRNGSYASIYRATVTYLKPQVASEPAGFFLQAMPQGPAVFVAVGPSTLSPEPAVGDRVSFDFSTLSTSNGMHQITGLSNWQVSSRGHPILPLVQDIGLGAHLPADLESELVGFAAVLGPLSAIGGEYVGAPITTATWGPASGVQLRIPQELQDSMDLSANCAVTLSAVPFWVSGAAGFPSAYSTQDFVSVSCPAPTVAGATALSPTTVLLVFDRVLDPATVLPDGSQFTISPPLTVVAAAVRSAKEVTLTTAGQTPGASYSVEVASTVRDIYSTGVGTPDTVSFTGVP